MTPSSNATIGGHAAARCRGEGGTPPSGLPGRGLENSVFLASFFSKVILCTHGSARFLVLTGACQFGHGAVGGFKTNFTHSDRCRSLTSFDS